MRKYVMPLIAMLALSSQSIAQGLVLKSAGGLVSITETQVVLHYQGKDHPFVVNKETQLLGGDGKKNRSAILKKAKMLKLPVMLVATSQ